MGNQIVVIGLIEGRERESVDTPTFVFEKPLTPAFALLVPRIGFSGEGRDEVPDRDRGPALLQLLDHSWTTSEISTSVKSCLCWFGV
jgi:hypothetical protein